MSESKTVHVDVIIPVHNAATTIADAVHSAMKQEIPQHPNNLLVLDGNYTLKICVCCYDDGSTDDSWEILQRLKQEYSLEPKSHPLSPRLAVQTSPDGTARGAGFARNRAIELTAQQRTNGPLDFLCLLDSDDTMHPHRVAEQVHHMLTISNETQRHRTLLGTKFERDPPDSTWHYSQWANALSKERLMLERFREVTIVQPTWFLCRSRWAELGGYVEAPLPSMTLTDFLQQQQRTGPKQRLIHPNYDTLESLRLAEDLRLFHDHLLLDGLLDRVSVETPLVTYRHSGTSQSFRTSRKLLLQLRVLALERSVLRGMGMEKFVIWGAGRDGKDFVKALSADLRHRIYCFVDVDTKKLASGYYVNKDLGVRIPIVHFSFLIKDAARRRMVQEEYETCSTVDEYSGRIDKSRTVAQDLEQPRKKRKSATARSLRLQDTDPILLQTLPVIVCVAMYRTNGALERNVGMIERAEGFELWHFS